MSPLVRRAAVAGGGILAASAVIAVVTLAARLAGLGRWLVFADTVNAACVGEAYAGANQVPNVLFEVVAGGALAGVVIPVLAGAVARDLRQDVDRIASALLTWAVVVLAPVGLGLALAAGPLTRLLLGPEACPGQHALAARMLTVFAPQLVLYGTGVVLAGVLQAHDRFLWPALAPLLSSLVVIIAYRGFAGTAGGAQDAAQRLPADAEAWLAWGTTVGVAALTLPLLVPVLRSGVRLRPTLRFPAGTARPVRALAVAGAGGVLAQQVAVVVTVWLANTRGETGAVNVYQYVQAVYLLPYAVLAVPVITAAFPTLARLAGTDSAAFVAAVAATLRAVVLVSALGVAGLVAAAPALGAFFAVIDEGRVSSLGAALTATAPGLVGLATALHAGRALSALQRGRAAALAGTAGWAVTTVAALVVVPLVPDPGRTVVVLGACGSAGMTVGAVLAIAALRRHAGGATVQGLARALGAAVSGVAAGVLLGRWVADVLVADGPLRSVPETLLAAVAAAVPAVVAVVIAVALIDPDDLAPLLRRVRRRPAGDHPVGGATR